MDAAILSGLVAVIVALIVSRRLSAELGRLATAVALPIPIPDIRILLVIRMALRAVGFASVRCRPACATEYVRATSYSLKMIGAHAQFVAAKVINLQSFRNGADSVFVAPSVAEQLSSFRATAARPEQTVPVYAASSPNPAAWPFADFRPETISRRGATMGVHQGLPPWCHAAGRPHGAAAPIITGRALA